VLPLVVVEARGEIPIVRIIPKQRTVGATIERQRSVLAKILK